VNKVLRADINSSRLHAEVLDFYSFVRPQGFEHAVRNRLVQKLQSALKSHHFFGDCELHPFGSFVTGLYLPTGDMDLVICSSTYIKRGYTGFHKSSHLFKFKSFLVQKGFADANSVQVITKAKVPLAKYVDRETGLRIDVSFDNLGGVTAVDRFMQWKKEYPAMPILVTLIKHYLAMRGLNEPVNGGIGGFSVICLVVSMLQLMPQVQSGALNPEQNLGDLLMEFFDLYGNHFNFESVAIRLNPPGYIAKVCRFHPSGFSFLSLALRTASN
jgi:non-canonical poly(A) RNA polymerase PAPD5/7